MNLGLSMKCNRACVNFRCANVGIAKRELLSSGCLGHAASIQFKLILLDIIYGMMFLLAKHAVSNSGF